MPMARSWVLPNRNYFERRTRNNHTAEINLPQKETGLQRLPWIKVDVTPVGYRIAQVILSGVLTRKREE